MNLIEYADRDMMMMNLANALAGELTGALMTHDEVSFAVPGGTTPGPVFDSLGSTNIEWDRVHVLLTDERWVPESSERSNTRLVREHLLHGNVGQASFYEFYTGQDTPEEALEAVTRGLEPLLPLSVLLLGMGTDMHLASLFPGADQLADALKSDAPPLMVMRAPGAQEPRLTLTAPVLQGAMSSHLVITGAEKRAALERAEKINDPLEAPVSLILKDATVHWAE